MMNSSIQTKRYFIDDKQQQDHISKISTTLSIPYEGPAPVEIPQYINMEQMNSDTTSIRLLSDTVQGSPLSKVKITNNYEFE